MPLKSPLIWHDASGPLEIAGREKSGAARAAQTKNQWNALLDARKLPARGGVTQKERA